MTSKFRAGTLAIAVSVALGTVPLYAAEVTDKSAEKEDVEKIVVVGSRSAPRLLLIHQCL